VPLQLACKWIAVQWLAEDRLLDQAPDLSIIENRVQSLSAVIRRTVESMTVRPAHEPEMIHISAMRVRTISRGMNDPFFTDDDLGFRCARSP
jgi:hypothetical protein